MYVTKFDFFSFGAYNITIHHYYIPIVLNFINFNHFFSCSTNTVKNFQILSYNIIKSVTIAISPFVVKFK